MANETNLDALVALVEEDFTIFEMTLKRILSLGLSRFPNSERTAPQEPAIDAAARKEFSTARTEALRARSRPS